MYTFCVCVCIPLRLVLGKCSALPGAHVQHSVSAENLPQTCPPYLVPARRTKPTNTETTPSPSGWELYLYDRDYLHILLVLRGPLPPHSGIGPLWMRAWNFQRSSQPKRRADPGLRGNPRHSAWGMGRKKKQLLLASLCPFSSLTFTDGKISLVKVNAYLNFQNIITNDTRSVLSQCEWTRCCWHSTKIQSLIG